MVNRLTLIARCLDRYGQRHHVRPAIVNLAIDIAIRRHYRVQQNYRNEIRIGRQIINTLHQVENLYDRPARVGRD